MRKELNLTKVEMPQQRLKGLWRVLDENASGFICAGEFGRFMHMHRGHEPVRPSVEANERKREEKLRELRSQDDAWKMHAARRAEATARNLALEAKKLEAALATVTDANSVSPAALPPISPNSRRGLAASQSAIALDANAALLKLARETLALSQAGRARVR